MSESQRLFFGFCVVLPFSMQPMQCMKEVCITEGVDMNA